MELLGKSLCIWFLWKSISLIKNPWVSFRLEKINGNQLNWFEVNRSENHRMIFLEICSSEVESLKTAFLIGERRIKITPMRGLPGETIPCKCNAWKRVSLKVNPGKLIWLMEKLWKLTSSIEKTYQPISSLNISIEIFVNDQKARKIVIIRQKSRCSIFFGETFMETFCWHVLFKKVFVDQICLEVVWASFKNVCDLIGSPYTSFLFNRKSVKNKFVHGESRETISRRKKP